MTPLEQLNAGWQWYQDARHSLHRLRRIADRYWAELPWEGKVAMERDNVLGKLEQAEVSANAKNAQYSVG